MNGIDSVIIRDLAGRAAKAKQIIDYAMEFLYYAEEAVRPGSFTSISTELAAQIQKRYGLKEKVAPLPPMSEMGEQLGREHRIIGGVRDFLEGAEQVYDATSTTISFKRALTDIRAELDAWIRNMECEHESVTCNSCGERLGEPTQRA